RLKMLKEAFKSYENIEVSDVETRLPKPCYTGQTLLFLKNTHPDHSFSLCLGEDSLVNFKSWYKWRQILTLSSLIVAKRPLKLKKEIDADLLIHTTFIEHKPVNTSSHEIRA